MHRSGITVDDGLKKEFAAAQKVPEILYIKVKLVNETFKKTEEGKAQADVKANFAAIADVLKPKDPCYILTRAGQKDGKWVIIFYVPDDSIVKEKTTYASSVSALREGLGAQAFVNDFHISKASECTAEMYALSTKEHRVEDLLTTDELIRREGAQAEGMAKGSVKAQAMATIDLAIDAKTSGALAEFKAGKSDAVIIGVNAKFDALVLDRAGALALDDIAKAMPPKDARYTLLRFNHENEGKATSTIMFVYYCPEAAIPKLKMSYSTYKSTVVRLIAGAGIEIAKHIECSEPAEIKPDAFLLELYPKTADKKTFQKAKPKGAKGKGGLINKTKFSAAPVKK